MEAVLCRRPRTNTTGDRAGYYRRQHDLFTGKYPTGDRSNYYRVNDPCEQHTCRPPRPKYTMGAGDLNPHQRLVVDYVHPNNPHARGLLCYHGVGSGKTLVMCSVVASYLQHDPDRVIIITVKQDLLVNTLREFDKVSSRFLFGEKGRNYTQEQRDAHLQRNLLIITFEELGNRLEGGMSGKWALSGRGSVYADAPPGRSGSGWPARGRDRHARRQRRALLLQQRAHHRRRGAQRDHGPAQLPGEAGAAFVQSVPRPDCRIFLMTATPIRNAA